MHLILIVKPQRCSRDGQAFAAAVGWIGCDLHHATAGSHNPVRGNKRAFDRDIAKLFLREIDLNFGNNFTDVSNQVMHRLL